MLTHVQLYCRDCASIEYYKFNTKPSSATIRLIGSNNIVFPGTRSRFLRIWTGSDAGPPASGLQQPAAVVPRLHPKPRDLDIVSPEFRKHNTDSNQALGIWRKLLVHIQKFVWSCVPIPTRFRCHIPSSPEWGLPCCLLSRLSC